MPALDTTVYTVNIDYIVPGWTVLVLRAYEEVIINQTACHQELVVKSFNRCTNLYQGSLIIVTAVLPYEN